MEKTRVWKSHATVPLRIRIPYTDLDPGSDVSAGLCGSGCKTLPTHYIFHFTTSYCTRIRLQRYRPIQPDLKSWFQGYLAGANGSNSFRASRVDSSSKRRCVRRYANLINIAVNLKPGDPTKNLWFAAIFLRKIHLRYILNTKTN